jgi:DNA-directed RNA polymerase subunit RPC12/RpoP
MKTHLKFHCLYCGQHMECHPRLAGRQLLCPTCLHRIVIPVTPDLETISQVRPKRDTWDTHVPVPNIMVPCRQGVGQERGQPCPRVPTLQATARGLSGPRSREGFQLAQLTQ